MENEPIRFEGLPASPLRVFACGADMKGGSSLFDGKALRLSGGHGDLSDPGRLLRFLHEARETAGALYAVPDLVAHDLHPAYYSRLAAGLFPAARRVAVQHHHAHVASVLAQHSCAEDVIGVAFDGAGYGTDGTIWGGEFLVVSPRGWKRCGRLGRLRMPGGDAAAREPWRMGLALLHAAMGEAAFDAPFPPARRASSSRPALEAMLARGVSSPLASSCGRLFDAVAALLGIAPGTQAEAEAAIGLERRASLSDDGAAYPFPIAEGRDGFEAGCGELVRGLISDKGAGVPVEAMARRFHNGLALLILRAAEKIREERGCGLVALCGGVFANRLLREGATEMLSGAGFTILDSPRVPVNDAGICVGQTWVALREGAGSTLQP